MSVRLRGDTVEHVELRIFEPPRFFEALLRGRSFLEAPDITARICGICPVAYQTSATNAMEDVCGVELPEPLRALRRLMYCGEWIESHALHVYMLHAPDFLGYDGAVELARRARGVERGLQLKKTGNEVLSLVGGREIHPINVRVGGFYRAPTRRAADALVDPLERALARPRWRPCAGRLGSTFPSARSSASSSRSPNPVGMRSSAAGSSPTRPRRRARRVRRALRRGARRALERAPLAPERRRHLPLRPARPLRALRELALAAGARGGAEAGVEPPCRDAFRSIVVRSVELVYACDEALRLIEGYERPDAPFVPVEPVAGIGYGVSEAPRGLLYHRYRIDANGTILDAKIVPPTSQNQLAIEDDLRAVVQRYARLDDEELRAVCEQAIRNFDPCISCATHFLDLTVERL